LPLTPPVAPVASSPFESELPQAVTVIPRVPKTSIAVAAIDARIPRLRIRLVDCILTFSIELVDNGAAA
jgi:hypothetical protein